MRRDGLFIGFLLGALTTTASAGTYVDAVEKERVCTKAGNYAIEVYNKRLKQPNMFLVEKTDADKQLLYPKRQTPHSKIANRIWLEVFVSETIESQKDAYMYGWATCMEQKF